MFFLVCDPVVAAALTAALPRGIRAECGLVSSVLNRMERNRQSLKSLRAESHGEVQRPAS